MVASPESHWEQKKSCLTIAAAENAQQIAAAFEPLEVNTKEIMP